MTTHTFHLPIKTKGGLNAREHFRARARRVKAERKYTALLFPMLLRQVKGKIPCVVRLSRFYRGVPMDDDGVQGALKGVRDEIALQLGFDDGSPLIDFVYGQHKASKPGIDVTVEVGHDVHVRGNCSDASCRSHWRPR